MLLRTSLVPGLSTSTNDVNVLFLEILESFLKFAANYIVNLINFLRMLRPITANNEMQVLQQQASCKDIIWVLLVIKLNFEFVFEGVRETKGAYKGMWVEKSKAENLTQDISFNWG